MSGLSHMMLKPASANALAMAKWVWLGVAIETKSMRSEAASFDSAATIS